jgi:biopolymer transport protein ExbD
MTAMNSIKLALCALALIFVPVLSNTAAAEDGPVMKVAVYADGRITADGRPVVLGALRGAFAQLKKANGSVLYYREAAGAEPHPNAIEVVRAIIEAKLSVSLSTKPDFSDVVLSDGTTKPR